MLFAMQLYGLYTSAYYDYIVEQIHLCTPLISLPARGRIFCGLDNLHALRSVVQDQHLQAAIAPIRNDALMQSCTAVPGRLDIYEDANDAPTSALMHITELQFDSRDIERLRLFGLDTIGKLRNLTARHLHAQFGQRGSRLYHFLHDNDAAPLPYYVPPPSIVESERFDEPCREPGQVMQALEQCVARACAQLGKRYTWRVEVASLDRADAVQVSRDRILRTGINTSRELLVHLNALVREMLSRVHQWWGLRIRLASLALPVAEQTALFTPVANADILTQQMMPRYAHVLRKIVIDNPWSVIPEEYGRCVPIRYNDTSQSEDAEL